ncbi:prephenate dehydrogenase/arogenate dehydrogenase family protein [Candidatus Nitrosocosmicus franklandus]|uniref:prephenate dehydrogenase/arogenate dehydrogenase family protein n=1 Tax=Candidatus Nitrosocosmicus franklandianus TaxID=1798806 RepID=UPI00106C4771|nr:prephenate dehydrogenase/arogenate dehydrogenase family protein [Candidatus Nitrosocosmicus franklandus]
MYNILIIGAGGRMGNWFFRYFKYLRTFYNSHSKRKEKISYADKEHFGIDKIFLVDRKTLDKDDGSDESNVYRSTQISDFIRESHIVVFCTPTEITIKLMDKLLNSFRDETIVVEVSSVKNRIHRKFKKYLGDYKKDLKLISIHPMFGPGALISSNSNIILHIPFDKSLESVESKLVKRMFPLYEIIKLDNAVSHDALISLVISLIYFMNLIFSRTLIDTIDRYVPQNSKDRFKFLKQISGSSYKVQSILSESILLDDTSLFNGLFLDSPKSLEIIKKYGKRYSDLVSKLEKKDKWYIENYVSEIKNEISSQVDLEQSYRLLYNFINKNKKFL